MCLIEYIAFHFISLFLLFFFRDLRAGLFEGASISSRPPEHGASDMAAGPSYSSSPLNYDARMIHFNVEYRDKNTPVVLPDNETVGGFHLKILQN